MLYLKEISKKYKFLLIIIEACILNVGVYYLDYYNIPVKLIKNYPLYIKNICLGIIVIVVLLSIIWNIVSKKNKVSYFDRLLFVSLIVEIIFSFINAVKFPEYYKNIVFVLIAINVIVIVPRLIMVNKNLKKINN